MPEENFIQEAHGDSAASSLTPDDSVDQSLAINLREATPVDLYFLLKEAFEKNGLSVSKDYYPDSSNKDRSDAYRLDFYISDPSATPDEFEKYRVSIRGSINGVDLIYFKAVEKRIRIFEQQANVNNSGW